MSSVPEHCRELDKCKSTARIGCTVNAMRVELRRQGVKGVSALNKKQLCELLHARKGRVAAASKATPITPAIGVFPLKCVKPQVCNIRAPSGCGVANMRDHIRRADPDVKGVWKMNKGELCKQLRPVIATNSPPPADTATVPVCMSNHTVKDLRSMLSKLNLNNAWNMSKGHLCKQIVTALKALRPAVVIKDSIPKVNYIWKDALRLSGPVGATVFQLPHGKQIYLFGDNHGGINLQCPKNDKNAIGIVDLLVQTFNDRRGPENTDLFIETWDGAMMDYEVKAFTDVLSQVDRRFRGEFKKRAKNAREFPSTRVHYADPRATTFKLDGYQVKNFWSDSLVKKYIDSPAKARKYVKLFVTSDDFAADMRTLVPTYKGKETRHAIRKQLSKLEAKDRRFLLERVDKELDYIFTAVNDEIYDKYRKALLSKSREIAEKITKKIGLDIGICLMDTYLLARLIYYVNKQKDGGLTVVHVGEHHKVNYANVLAKLYGPPVLNRNEMWDMDNFRCIDLGPTRNKKHELSENDQYWDKGGPRDETLLSKL